MGNARIKIIYKLFARLFIKINLEILKLILELNRMWFDQL